MIGERGGGGGGGGIQQAPDDVGKVGTSEGFQSSRLFGSAAAACFAASNTDVMPSCTLLQLHQPATPVCPSAADDASFSLLGNSGGIQRGKGTINPTGGQAPVNLCDLIQEPPGPLWNTASISRPGV